MGRAAAEEVVVIGIVEEQPPSHRCHIARGGEVARFRQAMGVLEGGFGHPQGFGRAVHAAGEGGFAAGDRLADGCGGIIGGADGGGADQVAELDPLARFQPELGGRLGGRVF